MDYKKVTVGIYRDSKESKLQFIDLEVGDIVLTDASSDDLKIFFDNLFDYIIKTKKLIHFDLDDEGQQDLFHDVSVDIVQQLNAEIKQSENNFTEIFDLKNPSS